MSDTEHTEPTVTPAKLLELTADWFEDELEIPTGLIDAVSAELEGGNKLELVRVLRPMAKPTRLLIVVESLE